MVEEDHELSGEDSLESQHHGGYCGVTVPPHDAAKELRVPQGLDPGVSPSSSTHPHSEELSGF